MNKILFNSFIAGATLLAFSSCDDMLDKVPDERVDLQSVEQVQKLLTTAYSTGNYGWLCEISSDNIIDINSDFYATQNDGKEILMHYKQPTYGREDDEMFNFEPVKSSTNSDSPSSIWEGAYNAIATANHALQRLDEIKAENNGVESNDMKAAYAEAYLIRAYHHFILVNIFSQAYKNDEASKQDVGIPYVTEPGTKLITKYERGNVTDTYKAIEADLLAGMERIDAVSFKYPKWHFNANAAHAFAARFYLYKRDYDKVIEHANAVLGTDRSTLPSLLMDYSGFDDCVTGVDYAEIWQGPDQANNLMLIATNSTQFRRAVGYRYATAGRALRAIEFHLGPNWNWYLMPSANVSGGTFWDGNSDHGFASAKIYERFEYTDKVSGIGYPHVIRREFTNSELLLMRAEAELLCSRHDVDGCVADLIAYDNSRQSFSESTYNYYSQNGKAMWPLTKDDILKYYSKPASLNCYENWDFTQNMSPDFIIPQDLTVYMNAINDMRRYETAYTGLRFFDLKRLGIEYSHDHGINPAVPDVMTWNDKRRAIELPQEVLAAGMGSSYEPAKSTVTGGVKNVGMCTTANSYQSNK